MAVNWTEEQRKVIDFRGGSLLVSAAAGSGKTAVLAERIASMVCDGDDPIDIDRLLVVTFTSAAAAQMRERVEKVLEKRLQNDLQNRHIQRQLSLIRQARITTIDSFCLSVIREQFYRINLDPSFRVADESELRVLKEEVLKQLTEKAFESGGEAFRSYFDVCNRGRDESRAQEYILKLYEFAMANPRPERWLERCRTVYEAGTLVELENSPWMRDICGYARMLLGELAASMEQTAGAFERSEGMEAFAEIAGGEAALIRAAAEAEENYSSLFDAVSKIRFGKKPRAKKGDSYDERTAGSLWEQRTAVKDRVEALIQELFFAEPEEMFQRHREAGKTAVVLIDLTLEFIRLFSAAKQKKGILDFHDMEHFALTILSEEKPDGTEVPTAAAAEYAQQFREIMIDEYQDSNLVQELILNSISGERQGRPNLFMVGDVKQSIYRFRLARPQLFMEKYRDWSPEGGAHARIELHRNFRSRKEILDAANFLFAQIMRENPGGVEYTEEAALHAGAAYPDAEDGKNAFVRLLLLDAENAGDPEEDAENAPQPEDSAENAGDPENTAGQTYTSRQWEAVLTANEILRITDPVRGEKVFDAELAAYRPAEYRDITILFRSLSGWAEDYLPILASMGIPAEAESGAGYFTAKEIQTVMNLLHILDNPLQDIPLAGVLLSPIGNFTPEELALIRLGADGQTDVQTAAARPWLYEALRIYPEIYPDRQESAGIRLFLEKLTEWRRLSGYLPVHELLLKILEETGYREYVLAMPGGSRRADNLDMLLVKAEQFEQTGDEGVFSFIRYLEKQKTYSVDVPSASDEGGRNTVRLMTIHHSKGLEFPIVILAGCGKAFNEQDSRQALILHADYGIGLDAADPELRTESGTLIHAALARELSQENLGEELRILYVAVTRAKERLIMTGCRRELFSWLEKKLRISPDNGTVLTWLERSSAGNYLDWIVPALGRHRCFDGVRRQLGLESAWTNPLYGAQVCFEVRLVTTGNLNTVQAARRLDASWYRQELIKTAGGERDPELRKEIEERLSMPEPSPEGNLRASLSVSELKKRFPEEEETAFFAEEASRGEEAAEPLIPAFLKDREPLTAARRGTVYHYLFQHLDPDGAMRLEEQAQRLLSRGVLSPAELEAVDLNKIRAFWDTGLGKRAAAAARKGLLRREFAFSLGVPAAEIYPETAGSPTRGTALVEIHGVIDAWFLEDGRLVLYDYKTDSLPGHGWEKVLLSRYSTQLYYYKRALEQMTGQRVEELYLYAVSRQEALKIDPDFPEMR